MSNAKALHIRNSYVTQHASGLLLSVSPSLRIFYELVGAAAFLFKRSSSERYSKISRKMATVKLTYFNIRGLGEIGRLLMKYNGQDFEDNRIEFQDWPKLKPAMPFGQMPVYEENGKLAHQSLAIARYLAKKGKLTGANDWEALMIDSIVDTVNDIRQKIATYFFESNEENKARLKTTLMNETIPYYFDRFEKIAKENNGHLAVGKLTWADFYFASLIDNLIFWTGTDLLAGRPNLQAVKNNVHSIPVIKEWVAKRPVTNF